VPTTSSIPTDQEPHVSAGPTDPSQPGQQREPTEEEVREYLGQLRAAPVDQVVAEVASALLNAAQVKLGRRDGRLLLDLVGDVAERTRPHLPSELTSQVDEALTQLRLAQVEAEREVAAAAQQGHVEPDDLGAASAAAAAAPAADEGAPAATTDTPQAPPQQRPPEPGGGAASRLWVPGR
jgi:hypothetical protein